MWMFIIGYIIFQIVLLLAIFVITNRTDRRSKKRNVSLSDVPDGFEKTTESFIDSRTNKVVHVYYNKNNGKRLYVETE